MKTLDQWLDEYGESHQDPVNKAFHWVCVPLITFSLLGVLWALHPAVALAFMGFALVFYARLSWRVAAVMGLLSVVAVLILQQMSSVFWPSVVIFVLAWIGQFIGHHVEGKKPSFFKDMQFLLIGPVWVVAFLFRRAGWRYAD
ncbi:Mpo1 family 2-hydroxy fatty acid dioxygenase [Atopomonas sediminilitoris]|uniref:Mpo1 family 2-hydroxy fatty acid dioxygenase n=1 Tax=Atopomonas sediminilitoris TaxID=2919919 RepID=UPI001F4EEB6C|nr:Mpo1-like protein [Atopomonas sediminilitoris]MCJ8169823.1 DUF962 domain-containing protein [Atopomonas sediminilitoris]